MDMNSRKSDVKKAEQGDWIDEIPQWGDLRLKVRAVGNTDYRRLQARLFAKLPRKKRRDDAIDPDEADRITAELLIKTVLLDWQNVTIDDASVPYSESQARTFITAPEFRAYSLDEVDFRSAVVWAANKVAARDDDTIEDAMGNSLSASDGKSSGAAELTTSVSLSETDTLSPTSI